MSRAHASIRQVIEHSDSIDLEQMGRYLEVLLSKKAHGGGEQWEVVTDYLSKVIDGINDHLDAEPVLCERPYRERLELHRAIDRAGVAA